MSAAALAALGEVIDDTRCGVGRYLGGAPPAHRQVPSDDRDLERTEASLRAADSHLAQALRFLAEAATEIDLAGQEVAHLPFGLTNDNLAVATAFVDRSDQFTPPHSLAGATSNSRVHRLLRAGDIAYRFLGRAGAA